MDEGSTLTEEETAGASTLTEGAGCLGNTTGIVGCFLIAYGVIPEVVDVSCLIAGR